MQRPRRTSEFQDDANSIRRLSRINQRGTPSTSPSAGSGMLAVCASGMAKQKNSRQSRIAVPLRPSSNDRSNTPYLTVATSSMRGVTPLKTPLQKNTATRALFTAEKQRTGNGAGNNSVSLHNDKKWVHEQTQRITEYLLDQNNLDSNLRTDLLNRGLRQMSIKQFLAVINYFLGYIWGSRFTVGANYVEDIVNILQKLHYPYAVNKSWLKTPNTQHSFGNVIVLLDFLMEFVPLSEKENDYEMYFNLKSPENLDSSRIKEESFEIPNLEFQRELLKNSEKGFTLWDKQKNEEFSRLKRNTCDRLLQEKCGIANLEAMNIEIKKCQEILKSVRKETPAEDKEMQKIKSKLSNELKDIRNEIKILQVECNRKKIETKNLGTSKMDMCKCVNAIEIEVKSLQEKLKTQSCTVDERDKMISEVVLQTQILGINQRTIKDLQNRYHNEQVLQSKAMKQLNDQIENFNAHMREIKFTNLMEINKNTSVNEGDLELCLKPQKTDLEKIIPLLEKINKQVLDRMHNNRQKILNLSKHCQQLTTVIDTKLDPELNILRTANTSNVSNLEKFQHSFKKQENKLLETIQRLDNDIGTADITLNKLQSAIENRKIIIEELVRQNEQLLQNAEQKHQQCLEQKRAFLQLCDEICEERSDDLLELTRRVQLQEKQLEQLGEEFNKLI